MAACFICLWYSDMFIRYKTAFFSKHTNGSKAGVPIEKSNFWGIIFSLKLGLWVIQKMTNFRMSACFRVAGVQIFLLDIKIFLLQTYERQQSGRPYRKKESLKHHIWSEFGVVGHPKMINSWVSAYFAVVGVQICLLDTNNISSPNIWTTAKQAAISKKTIFEE